MFEREQHRAIAIVLDALDASALRAWECFFAGGTRIALDHGEFRESRDADFLCFNTELYADLRMAVRDRGYSALFSASGRERIDLPREIRADQYGVRFPVVVGTSTIRVEIVKESRFELGAPVLPSWSAVPCIRIGDCFTAKLLANSDRWADRDSLARDLLDLAVLSDAHGPIPPESWRAAERAYKSAVRDDLTKASELFLTDAEHRSRCFEGLAVRPERHAALLEAVEALVATS
jgi:hypothetical protein